MRTRSDGDADDAPAGPPSASLPKRAFVAAGLTVAALVLSRSLPAVVSAAPGTGHWLVGAVAGELAFPLLAVLFIATVGDGDEWVALALPADRSAYAQTVVDWAGKLAAFALLVAIAASRAGVETGVARLSAAPGGVGAVLLTVVLFAVVVAPAEELFFRGVVQRYLRAATSARGAVVGAALLFALVHLPGYRTVSPTGAALSTAVVVVLGLGLGAVYERTGSLPVAVGVHALYNTLVLLGLYLAVTGGLVTPS